MCGIAGIWGKREHGVVQEMIERMAHRGPDAKGMYDDPKSTGVLGHCRLSIMDVNGGDQPIHCERQGRAIVANGEIYNYPIIRALLADRYQFRTRSDTECALHLYDQLGTGTAARLDGMFALAIVDGDEIYVARDAIGIKPLYYGQRDGAMVFSSELKALAGLAVNVREFPPGTWFHSKVGFRTYYRVSEESPRRMPFEEDLRNVRETLERAVTKRLMSDVPVGAFLSGGLDSSLIAAIACRHTEKLHTFSVGVEASRDLEAARRVARHLGTIHHELVYSADDVRRRLPEIVYFLESFDQDLVRSAIPCYFASQIASDHVKVVLTGEGADELFAGYDYYKDIADPGALQRELRRSVSTLHNINLQRVDRLTMAHSIEGRVPFLDVEMIEMAHTIPPELKLHSTAGGQKVEKWILRKACEDLLPREIIWRDKEQFDEGSGTVDIITPLLDTWLTIEEAEAYIGRHPEARLRSREECVYHKLLMSSYRGAEAVLDNVARWSERSNGD